MKLTTGDQTVDVPPFDARRDESTEIRLVRYLGPAVVVELSDGTQFRICELTDGGVEVQLEQCSESDHASLAVLPRSSAAVDLKRRCTL